MRRDLTARGRRLLLGRGRRQPAARRAGRRRRRIRRRARSTSGPTPRLTRSSARRPHAHRQAAIRHRAQRQRARRSAGRVRRQEPAVHRVVDRGDRHAYRRGRRSHRARRSAARGETLFRVRARRPRPHLDDKILTSWNGLMIAAWARASRVVGGLEAADGHDYRVVRGARRAVRARASCGIRRRGTLLAPLARRPGRHRRVLRGLRGARVGPAGAVPGERRRRVAASGRSSCRRGRTSCSGTRPRAAGSTRPGAIRRCCCGSRRTTTAPSRRPRRWVCAICSSSRTWSAMPGFAARAERTLARLGPRRARWRGPCPCMLTNLVTWHAGLAQIVIVGPRDRAGHAGPAPRDCRNDTCRLPCVVPVEPGESQDASAASSALDRRRWRWSDGRATAYVCRQFACERPVSSPEALAALLGDCRDAFVGPTGAGPCSWMLRLTASMTMQIPLEIMLRGDNRVFTQKLEHPVEAGDWTDGRRGRRAEGHAAGDLARAEPRGARDAGGRPARRELDRPSGRRRRGDRARDSQRVGGGRARCPIAHATLDALITRAVSGSARPTVVH